MAHPKRQHYVPKLLLRGFADGEREQLYALDKTTGKAFLTSVRNVATEKAFYDLKTDAGLESLESGLSRLESVAAPLISRIRVDRSLAFLTPNDREMLALFAMVQHQRTTNYREKVAKMNADLLAKIRGMGFDTTNIDGIKEFNAQDLQRFAMQSIGMAINFVPHILDKAWILLAAPGNEQFYLADNPIALQNRKDFGAYGNIGFAVPGIEIFLPLSSELCLAWYSSSFVEEFTDGVDTARQLKTVLPQETARLDANIARLTEFLDAARSGHVMQCEVENVVNVNAGQLFSAERFIFSRGGDFSLAIKILGEKPHWRTGPRGKVG
jgi:hypothetical protein